MTTKKPMTYDSDKGYTTGKRIKSGIKRFVKLLIPMIPLALEWLTPLDVPYKETMTVTLLFIVALEKAIQKDRS